MDLPKVGLLGLLVSEVAVPFNWMEAAKEWGVLALFAYYILFHEPRARQAEHDRRMEEIKAIKEDKEAK